MTLFFFLSISRLHFLLTISVVDLLRVWCHSNIVCCTFRRWRSEWWRYCNRIRVYRTNGCRWRRRLRLHTEIRPLSPRRTSSSSAVRALGKEAEMERRLGQRVENCEERGMGDEVEGSLGASVERIWSACKQNLLFFFKFSFSPPVTTPHICAKLKHWNAIIYFQVWKEVRTPQWKTIKTPVW